eukprot:TRINITY_DN51178_c0_g1_i1.p1 TRINITY_DN51178_c0_g1~~TRINITY_DN51178_c0_g1_i1.p1  ORF type:complete len:1535 (-),score=316.55 TRINITY_DN51178_c0_g1_i1:180-4784(-)
MPASHRNGSAHTMEDSDLSGSGTRHCKMPRNVRGVAQALDQGNLKLALKRSEAVLERHGSHVYCKALRALALELSGSRQEALLCCREVQLARSSDPNILGYIRNVYQRAGMYERLTEVYEVALAEDPTCEELGVCLYLALASQLRLQRQQQVALQLFRRHGGTQYLLWAVGAILAQVPTFGPHRSLDLADMLLQRCPVDLVRAKREGAGSEKIRDSYLVLIAHLTTLRQQGKYSQALRLLEVHEEAISLPVDVARLRLQLFAESVQAHAAVEEARNKFLRAIDQWMVCRDYIALAFVAEGFLRVVEGQGAEVQDDSPHSSGLDEKSPRDSDPRAVEKVTAQQSSALAPISGVALSSAAKAVAGQQLDLLDFAGRTGGAATGLPRRGLGAGGVAAEGAAAGGGGAGDDMFAAVLATAPQARAELQRSGQEVRDAYSLLMHLQKTARDHGSRTPFLGELEMRALAFACSEAEYMTRASATGEPVDMKSWMGVVPKPDQDDYRDLIVGYFTRYSHRGVACCTDLKPYLCIMDDGRVKELLRKIRIPLGEEIGAEALSGRSAGAGYAPTVASPIESGQVVGTASGAPGAASRQMTKVFDPSDWAANCSYGNQLLAIYRLERSLRALDALPLEQAASELSVMLQRWARLHALVAEDSASTPADAAGKGDVGKRQSLRSGGPIAYSAQGVGEEMRPSVEVDDILVLVAAHLLDLDRRHCAQRSLMTSGGGRAKLPALRDRGYLLDLLTLLELGAQQAPRCTRIRLLLAVVYGAVGAAAPLKKWLDSIGLVRAQWEGLGHLALNAYFSLGWWEELPDVCNRFKQLHEEFDRTAQEELARVYEDGGPQGSLHRSREYASMYESMRTSVMRGRSIVEHAITDIAKLSDCGDKLHDYLHQHVKKFQEVASRSCDAWTAETQAHGIFQGLHYLPRCSPLQALRLGLIGAPLVAPPSQGALEAPLHWMAVFRRKPAAAIVSSAACTWPSVSSGDSSTGKPGTAASTYGSPVSSGLPLPPPEPSGLEELLLPRRDGRPGVLKLRAVMLLLMHCLLRPQPSEQTLAELLHELQVSLAAEGIVAHCDPGALFRTGAAATFVSTGAGSVPQTPRHVGEEAGSSGASALGKSRKNLRMRSSNAAGGSNSDSSRLQARKETGGGGTPSPARGQTPGASTVARDQEDTLSGAQDTAPVGIEDPKAGLPPPWRPALVTADDLFWRCILLTGDVAHRTLQAALLLDPTDPSVEKKTDEHKRLPSIVKTTRISVPADASSFQQSQGVDEENGSQLLSELFAPTWNVAWESLKRGLVVLRLHVRECARVVLEDCPHAARDTVSLGVGVGAGASALVAAGGTATLTTARRDVPEEHPLDRAEPFRMGGHGIQTLSAFISGPLIFMLPVLNFISSKLMRPVEIPKKAGPIMAADLERRMNLPPPGGAAAEECRSALGKLVKELLAVLKDVYAGLIQAQAEEFDHLGGGCSLPPATPIKFPDCPGFSKEEVQKTRRMVGNSLVAAHQRQLASLDSIISDYIGQLKQLNTFARERRQPTFK